MKDEEFLFLQDSREKKIIGRSYYNRKNHAGKVGTVRFPSDGLTKKELESMNGETKTYKMNSPMNWQEFRGMPDDLKIAYIKALRKKFAVPNIEIAKMFGCSKPILYKEFKRLGGLAVGSGANHGKWEQEAEWFAWLDSRKPDANTEATVEETPNATEDVSEANEPECQDAPQLFTTCIVPAAESVIPRSGNLVFECEATQALDAISRVLGNANVRISVSWQVLAEQGACES